MKKFRILILLICFLVPATFVGCKKTNKSTLSTPTIYEVNGGTIIFSSIDGADYYTISINNNEIAVDADNNKFVEIIDNKINYDASKIFVVGDNYSIKIQAHANKRPSSSFSTPITYQHYGNITKPKNVKINSTILTWDSVKNAHYYKVKMVTPTDTAIFDKNGNLITQDDSTSIGNADLTEYIFNTNQFDFSSLLTSAGIYKFYVSAVIFDGTNQIESGYTSKVEYSHIVALNTAINSSVFKVDNDLYLRTVIDDNANALAISCNGFERTTELNSADHSLEFVSTNVVEINLNKFFKTFIDAGKINFNEAKQFTFSTQNKYISNQAELTFYTNAQKSSLIIFDNTITLETPTLSVEFNEQNNAFVASWKSDLTYPIGEYKLYVATSVGLMQYELDNLVNSMILPTDFIAVAIQAIGSGNYLSSTPSLFISNPTLSNSLGSLNLSSSGNSLSWNDVEADYYIISIDNQIYLTTELNFTPTTQINNGSVEIVLTAVKNEFACSSLSATATFSTKLSTPTFSATQGFNSKNIYELTFTGSENAMGYNVYIKGEDSHSFVLIDKLYTTTAIDLSQYITSEDGNSDFEIKVQAIAEPHSGFVNSELSESVSVSHIKVLEKPEFNKIGDTTTPVIKQYEGNQVKYFLKFNGVQDAGSYEILINSHRFVENAINKNYTGSYEVDITSYLKSANLYNIKVRALPDALDFNIKASEYSETMYVLRKQLDTVRNVEVNEQDGVYILSFDPVNNAQGYRIRIVKENDSDYANYLHSIGLSHTFDIDSKQSSIYVTDYVKLQGSYYFYVTALASNESTSYYSNANESNWANVDKLTSLNAPKDILITEHANNTSYTLSWTGDEHADSYLIKITSPNGTTHEIVEYSTSTDIQKYMTIQGQYTFTVSAIVAPLSDSSKEYNSSEGTIYNHTYTYNSTQDFLRYSVYMYGEKTDFAVDSIQELKNLLWYNYLYKQDSYGLTLMLTQQTGEEVKDSIIRLAQESVKNDIKLYDFTNDSTWQNKLSGGTSNAELFKYMCEKLLKIYPEFNNLEWGAEDIKNDGNIFTLHYQNTLNDTKIESSKPTTTTTNYGNEQKYIDIFSRKSATGVFAIDSYDEMLVTTTEQLLHAVQSNRKPKFVGESAVAETVYANAKLVLSAIVTNNMSELEKTEAIFNWLENNFYLLYYLDDSAYKVAGSMEASNIATYGKFKHYYLEGIFDDISILENGDLVIGNSMATSFSYSKAFALLCRIEGIEAIVVNGEYTTQITFKDATVLHAWNKVKISTSSDKQDKKWYAVDLTFSDNYISFNSPRNGYGVASHTHFLKSDAFNPLNITLTDKTDYISQTYKNSRVCTDDFDYYSNSSFALSYSQIDKAIDNFAIRDGQNVITTGFEYSLAFKDKDEPGYKEYQRYNGIDDTNSWNDIEVFLFNAFIYAQYNALENTSGRSMFEFTFNYTRYNSIPNLADNPNGYFAKVVSLINSGMHGFNIKFVKSYAITNSSTSTMIFVVEKNA